MRWPLEGTLIFCGTANSVAKLPWNTLTSKLGTASADSAAVARMRATGAGAGMGAPAIAATGACGGGGGSMPMRHGLGSGPCVAAPGWPVERVSCTPSQSSPVFCATSAWRSNRTFLLALSSVAR